MKKIFIFMVSLIFPMYSVSNVLDGGEVRFHGFVVNDSPKWLWRIASPEQMWNIDIDDAQKDGDLLVFDINNIKDLPFLEGYLQDTVERGGPGLTPTITYSSEGARLNEYYSRDLGRILSIPVRDTDSNKVVGNLSFSIEEGMAIHSNDLKNNKLPRGMSLLRLDRNESYYESISPKLIEKLSILLGYSKQNKEHSFRGYNGNVFDTDVLMDSGFMNFTASYASFLSNFKLYVSMKNTPKKWRAKLNVTVSVN